MLLSYQKSIPRIFPSPNGYTDIALIKYGLDEKWFFEK